MISLLRDRVTIERATTSKSASGEVSQTSWPAVASNIPASVQPRSGSFRQREAGREQQSNYLAFFNAGVDVRVGDRVLVITTGIRYLVTFVANQYSGHHLEVDLSQLVTP